MAQAPGPRASPQLPHGLADAAAAGPLADTANTESWVSSFLPWHLGHSAFWLPYTRASNSCLHALQMYSKIGMSSPETLRSCSYLKSGSGKSANRDARVRVAPFS